MLGSLARLAFTMRSLANENSRTPRRAATRIALHAGPVPHQREIPALAAHLAFVALGLGLGAAFGLGRCGLLRRCRPCSIAALPAFRSATDRAGLPASARPRLRRRRRRARCGPCEAIEVTLPEPRASVCGSLPPRMTTRLSVRERVRPFDRYLLLGCSGALAFLDALAHGVEVGLRKGRHGRDRSGPCS